MANKCIPINDKETVIQRLAEGQSTRQAIKGTSIASNQTAARIARIQSHTIAQKRQDYMDVLNRFARSGENYRAGMLVDMVWADKKMRIRSSGPYGVIEKLVDVPDWDMRLKAIKYIDQIDGIMPTGGSQINLLQRFN